MKVGILHPGAMGTDIGRVLSAKHDVMWAGEGRSENTRRRASEAGFAEKSNLASLVNSSDVVVSICPPAVAASVAQSVSSVRSDGFLYIDANTVAPGTVREISGLFASNAVVDVALTGAPGAGNLTLWTSGTRESEVRDLFIGTRVAARKVGEAIGQASAFKMCAGLRSKVIPAIWAALIDAAAAAGPEVEGALRAHLDDIGHDLDGQAAKVAERAPKAWRWVGEMEESAKMLRELGLPDGLSEAAAEMYRRIAAGSSSAGHPATY